MSKKMKLTEVENLCNEKCCVEFNPISKQIYCTDSVDQHNMPAFYTTTKRGLEKAWVAVAMAWHDAMTMHDVWDIVAQNKIATHYWCRMD